MSTRPPRGSDDDADSTLAAGRRFSLDDGGNGDGPIPVRLARTEVTPTGDQVLWTVIRNSAEVLKFPNYQRFMDAVMCGLDPSGSSRQDVNELLRRQGLPFPDVDAYRRLKAGTELFLMANCGVVDFARLNAAALLDEEGRLGRPVSADDLEEAWKRYQVAVNGETAIPYLALIRAKFSELSLKDIPTEDGRTVDACYGLLRDKLVNPCLIELIWSYWHEEGMLVQSISALSLRFQNRRGRQEKDPLATFETDPLRPLNNLLWGYIQDEQHRLSVPRRAYEYDHHYGLTLAGKAVPRLRAADSRTKFLEAFHNLLYRAEVFYKQDDDTTVIADGFPVLNGLKEVHLLLSQGAHNQYGDLPWTARHEMLMQQWLLARPEMREFLPSRVMVAYPEAWMGPVDTMKTLQAWTDSPVTHFRDLGVFGEQILLSIRFGAWSEVFNPAQAANWARYWRPEIKGYIHAYGAVTGVMLSPEAIAEVRQPADRYVQPSAHLRRRLAAQRQAR